MKKKRVLSGIQPSGKPHLGNLLGAISNWVNLQDKYDCFFFIADLHALTVGYENPKKISSDVNEVLLDLLAAGLDPNKCTIFKQSDLPEHSELHLLFSMITPLPWLYRIPTYKSKIDQIKEKDLDTYGFLGYPILQAADILMYKADFVPVGEDQKPHIELTREIARRFNNYYGEVFPYPEDLLTKTPTVLGLDGRKMSKSYGNTIAISDSPEIIRKKIQSMITDPQRIKKEDKGHPEVCPVFSFHKLFNIKAVETIERECKGAERGCVACKKELAEQVVESLSPIQKRREELMKNPDEVLKTLKDGTQKAKQIAVMTLAEAKKAMGL